jgi:hypothetical protein
MPNLKFKSWTDYKTEFYCLQDLRMNEWATKRQIVSFSFHFQPLVLLTTCTIAWSQLWRWREQTFSHYIFMWWHYFTSNMTSVTEEQVTDKGTMLQESKSVNYYILKQKFVSVDCATLYFKSEVTLLDSHLIIIHCAAYVCDRLKGLHTTCTSK